MATFNSIYQYRHAVVFWGILEIMLFSAIVYGWSSLVFVFKEESYFADLCSADPVPANTTRLNENCAAQDDLLNLAFTIGAFTFQSLGIIAGALLDHCGIRVTRLIASATFCLTWLIFGFMNKDRPMLMYPGVVGLTLSGILLFIPILQISVMFGSWHSLVASLFCGSVDSSSVVPLFFKLIRDSGVGLQWIFTGYFILAITSTTAFTFVLPAKPIRVEQVEKYLGEKESDSKCLIEEESDIECKESLEELFEQTDPTTDTLKAQKGSFKEFWKIATSPMYLFLVMYLSIHKLRLWFYIGSVETYLHFATDNNTVEVDTYLNYFGIMQFTGLLFSPVVGVIMAWRPASKQNKTFGYIVAIVLTNSLDTLLNVTVLVPVLQLQVLSFIVQVVFRAFLYSTYAAFALHRFPHEHYGKLYGTGHCIAAIIALLQFYLFVIVESRLKGNPFWVNVGFLVLTLVAYVFPFYIWVVTERETKAKQCDRKYHALKAK